MSAAETSKPNLRTEAIAGITTFFTMAYIVVVNPSILSTPGTGMAFSGVLTATVLRFENLSVASDYWHPVYRSV